MDMLAATILLCNVCVTCFSVSMVLSVYCVLCVYKHSPSSGQGESVKGTGHNTGTDIRLKTPELQVQLYVL